MIAPFAFARLPRIVFGPGKRDLLGPLIRGFGEHVLVVTAGTFLDRTGHWEKLLHALEKESIACSRVTVSGEPSPEFVDGAAREHRRRRVDVVLAVGGGSAVDAGKAVSAMLPQEASVYEFLEGVGKGEHDGRKVPFIAVPTTSGTGSEATKNAVLSRVGPDGFKKSIRHDNLVPDIALIDPELTVSCPPEISAACGMDAFTQLLESYVSTEASPLTDALAFSGISHLKDSLIPVCTTDPDRIELRASMAYASLLSGVTLANAGLGIVHGLASSIGGYFSIPHGVVCGTLLAAEVRVNVGALRTRARGEASALEKYARIGALLAGGEYREGEADRGCDLLIETLDRWTETLGIARLERFGITASDLDRIVAATGNKNNPVELDEEEIKELVSMRL